jgi:hypothetical protein
MLAGLLRCLPGSINREISFVCSGGSRKEQGLHVKSIYVKTYIIPSKFLRGGHVILVCLRFNVYNGNT